MFGARQATVGPMSETVSRHYADALRLEIMRSDEFRSGEYSTSTLAELMVTV